MKRTDICFNPRRQDAALPLQRRVESDEWGPWVLVGVVALVSLKPAAAIPRQAPPPEIIDMHVHVEHVADYGPTPTVCSDNRTIAWLGPDPRVWPRRSGSRSTPSRPPNS